MEGRCRTQAFIASQLQNKVQFAGEMVATKVENRMQDLFQKYVDDVSKLRDAFHEELAARGQELSKAMDIYAQLSEAALASIMEKVSARGVEVEAAAAARLNQFRGLPANGGLNDGPLAPTNADQVKIETAAERAVAASLELERAVAASLDLENDADRKLRPGRPMTLIKSDPASESTETRLPPERGEAGRRGPPASGGRGPSGAMLPQPEPTTASSRTPYEPIGGAPT
jgi:hypothetical protein